VFKQFDTDRNGVLDKKELSRALKALPKIGGASSVDDMVNAMDENSDGVLTEEEWLRNLRQCAALASVLASVANDAGVVENFRSFEQQKAKREREVAALQAKVARTEAEDKELAECARQVASLARKIDEANANEAKLTAAPGESRTDPSDGGSYTRAEFVAYYGSSLQYDMAGTATAPLLRKGGELFAALDTDQSGQLSYAELFGGLTDDPEAAALLGGDSAEEVLATWDLDGDAELSWEECKVILESLES